MVRILLIQTVRSGELRPDIGLSTLYLAAYLEKYEPGKFEIKNVYADRAYDISGLNQEFDLVGISSVSCTYESAMRLGSQVKKAFPDTPVVLGGAHINSAPESLSRSFDCAILGEGEETFRELCNLLHRDGKITPESMRGVAGIMYWNGGILEKTAPRKYIEDINSIPFPDRGVFFQHSSIPSIITSRGCPHSCLFCANAVYGNKVRIYTPENIYKELKSIVTAYPQCKVIVFKDDIFTLRKDVLRRLAPLISADPAFARVKFVCQGHVRFLDDETVVLLRRMGFKKLLFGFESMSERMLGKIKPGLKPQDNMRAMELCAKHGIWCGGNFIIGFPEETEEDILATYNFMLENLGNGKLFMVTTTILMPFPGTYYWQIAKEKGLLGPGFNWDKTEDIGFIAAWENSHRTMTVQEYWKMRQDLGLLYIGSQSTETMCNIMDRYETEVFRVQERNIILDRANV